MAQSPPTLRSRLSDAVRLWAASTVAKDGDAGSGIWGGAFSTFMGMSTSGGGPGEVKDNPADYARARTAESYVFTAEQVRSRAVSQVPLRIWQVDAQGKKRAIEHEALGILEETNPYGFVDGVAALMRMTLGSLDFQGRACWQLAFDRRGLPSEIYWLQPTQWVPVPDKTTWFKGIRVRDDDGVREVPANQLCYFVTDNPLDPLLGTSRIAVLKNPINLRAFSQWSNIDFFRNSMRPDWMLSGSFANTEDNIERLRRGIRRMLSGANNRAPLILGEGMQAHLLTTSHEDAQWVEQQRLAQEEISAVFGVPLVYLNNLERSTYENIRVAKLIMWHDTMIPELDDLADRLNRRYFWRFWPDTKGRKMTFGFDYDEIEGLGEDLALIWERVVKMSHQITEQVKQRELTPHQARMLRDQLFGDLGIDTSAFQGTIPGGDQFYELFQNVPVEQLSVQAIMDVWAMRGQNPEFVEAVPGAENADSNADDVIDRLLNPPAPPPAALPPGSPPNGKPPAGGAPAAQKPPGPSGKPAGGAKPPAPKPKSADELRAELREQAETSRKLKRYFQDQQTAALRTIRQGEPGDLYDRGAFQARLVEIVGPVLARRIEAETQENLRASPGDQPDGLEARVKAEFRFAIDHRAAEYADLKARGELNRPLHDEILEAEAHYARKVGRVLRGALDVEQVARDWMPWASQAKAVEQSPPETLMFQARSYAATLGLSLAELVDVLKDAYGDSWLLGMGSALKEMGSAGFRAQVGEGAYAHAASLDWSSWKPGNPAAADQILGENGGAGLQQFLDDAGIVIQGVTDTTLEGIARVLGEGAAAGDSWATIAAGLTDLLDDPARAEMISRTEMARGVSAATLETYGFNGVEAKGWITFNPCQLCQRNASQVIPLDASFASGDQAPPAHPHCRCSLTPERLSGESLTAPAVEAKELVYQTARRSATHDHSTDAGFKPTIVLDLHGTITPSDGFTAPDQPGSLLAPFQGCREALDRLVAGGCCLHLCTAALSPYHAPEILAARRKLIDAYLTTWGLPISFVSGKVGAHVYYDDRMVKAAGDWQAIMKRVLFKLGKRFEVDDAGIWRRKDIPDTGTPVEVFPSAEDTTPDQPRGLSTPCLDVDLHRCLFESSSSKLEGGLKAGALNAVRTIYQAGYTVNLSCAGWDPATHPPVESAQRLASLRRQVRAAGVPYDEMCSKDHPDVSIDDKGLEHVSWVADLPVLLAALGTPHPEDEVTLRGEEPAPTDN